MYWNIRDYGNRLLTLQTEGYGPRAYISFCPNCPFQYEPKTLGSSQCPNCHHQLHGIGPVSDVQRFQTDKAYRTEQCRYR